MISSNVYVPESGWHGRQSFSGEGGTEDQASKANARRGELLDCALKHERLFHAVLSKYLILRGRAPSHTCRKGTLEPGIKLLIVAIICVQAPS
jgi:hypothetical protein